MELNGTQSYVFHPIFGDVCNSFIHQAVTLRSFGWLPAMAGHVRLLVITAFINAVPAELTNLALGRVPRLSRAEVNKCLLVIALVC